MKLRQFRINAGCFLSVCILLVHIVAPGAAAQSVQERIAEVGVHGNVTISGDEIARIAGLPIGGPLLDGALDAAKRRLEKSGKFESVEVLKRYRSITDFSQVAVLLVVHERPELEGPAV